MPIVVAKSNGRSVTVDLGGLALDPEVGWEDGGLSSAEEGGAQRPIFQTVRHF